jgi:hypothetical protein
MASASAIPSGIWIASTAKLKVSWRRSAPRSASSSSACWNHSTPTQERVLASKMSWKA